MFTNGFGACFIAYNIITYKPLHEARSPEVQDELRHINYPIFMQLNVGGNGNGG